MKKYIYGIALFLSIATMGAANANKINPCIDQIAKYQSNNQLEFPPGLCQFNDGDIPAIVDYLNKHTEIDMLIIDNNNIGAQGATLLATNHNLDYIDIKSNHLGDKGVTALASNPSLQYLDASDNQIGNAGAIALAKNNSLSELFLWYNEIGPEGVSALAKNPVLDFLCVDHNKIGDEGAVPLVNSNISVLSIDQNNISDQGAAVFANKQYQALSLNLNNIGPEGAIALAKNGKINELDLYGNHIGPKGAIAVSQNQYISMLDISQNAIGSEGAKAIAKNPLLQSIDLSDNELGDEGAIGFAKNLAKDNKLAILALQNNNIGTNGFNALAEAPLSSNFQLNLNFNTIDDNAAEALKNIKVSSAFLSHNNLRDKSAQALALNEAIYNCLDVSYNHISPSGIQVLEQASHFYFLDTEGNDGPKKQIRVDKIKQHRELFEALARKLYCANKNSSFCKKLVDNKSEN